MKRLLLITILALSGCALRFGHKAQSTDGATTAPATATSNGIRVGAVIDVPSPQLCSPEEADPQHTCPDRSGPAQP
ncbi:MAG TPA: hypothetical protein VE964_13350 [Myxococcales bacterium]|nr:hypothetical protein [Myxococcales bacterium]